MFEEFSSDHMGDIFINTSTSILKLADLGIVIFAFKGE
jgi:hypothetical protein